MYGLYTPKKKQPIVKNTTNFLGRDEVPLLWEENVIEDLRIDKKETGDIHKKQKKKLYIPHFMSKIYGIKTFG